jgi:hypothetical protein
MVNLSIGDSGTGGAGVREFVLECVRRLVCICQLVREGFRFREGRGRVAHKRDGRITLYDYTVYAS